MDFFLPLGNTDPVALSEDEVASFALRTGWIDDIGVIVPGQTMIERRALNWWPGYDLIIARDVAWSGSLGAWLLKEGERLVRLDGSSSPIHSINARFKPQLGGKNALAYLGFFCTFVQGSVEGQSSPFMPIASMDDPNLPSELDEEKRGKISQFMRGPAILKEEPSLEQEGRSDFHIESLIYYADALFLSNFLLKANGKVEMLEDEPLVQNLDAWIKIPLRFELPSSGADNLRS